MKKSDFAKMIGVVAAYVDTYVKRGRVVVLVDNPKMVDITDPTNADFARWVRENKKAKSTIPVEKKSIEIPKVQIERKISEPLTSEAEKTVNKIMIRKNEADLEKKLVDIEEKKLKNSKLRGETIPTKMVKDLIAQLSKSMISAYKDSAQQLLVEFSHRKKLSASEESEMNGELIKIINSSHDKAISEAKKQLEVIVSTVSDQVAQENDSAE